MGRMSEIRFYHLQRKPLETALPEILEKALIRHYRAVVILGDDEKVETINQALWTYAAESFLPHGSAENGFAAEQPVYLTALDENPNKANLLILAGGGASENIDAYDLCCEIFDGNDDDAVIAARARWAAYKDQGHTLIYFQQDDDGRWQQKATA